MPPFSALDLFAGCGGLTLGLKWAGFKVLGAVDIDPLAIESYKLNHPEVAVWESDIRKVSGMSVKRKLGLRKGGLDLLAGCPPCQGFSSLRTLNRAKAVVDSRNDLVFEFVRFVEELAPRSIMMENVPGLGKDRRIARVWQQLNTLGYKGEHQILNTADYGVPQCRRRLILLASRDGKIPFAAPLASVATVRMAIESLPPPGGTGDTLHDHLESRGPRVTAFIQSIPKNGGSRKQVPGSCQIACHKGFDGFKDVFGRLAWDRHSSTITSGCTNPSKGRFLHPEQDRAITLREAALLQSFPRDYQISMKRGKIGAAVLIGNALPPKFIEHHAQAVANFLQQPRKV